MATSSSMFSRPDPCSVDFGREAPKFWFEFCRGFLGGFFPPVFSKEKGPTKSTKNPPKNSPRTLIGKIPLGFFQKPRLDIFYRRIRAGISVFRHLGLTRVTFVSRISDRTTPFLPPTSLKNTEIATLHDTILHYIVWECFMQKLACLNEFRKSK